MSYIVEYDSSVPISIVCSKYFTICILLTITYDIIDSGHVNSKFYHTFPGFLEQRLETYLVLAGLSGTGAGIDADSDLMTI